MVCHRVQPGTPAISYKLIATLFLVAVGVFLTPILHRALHRFHLDLPD